MRKKKNTPPSTKKNAASSTKKKLPSSTKPPSPKRQRTKAQPKPQPESQIAPDEPSLSGVHQALEAFGEQTADLIEGLGLLRAIQFCDSLAMQLASFCPLNILCPDCHAALSTNHKDGCGNEQCPYCGLHCQGCECDDREAFGTIPDDDRIPFSGHLPYAEACCKLGWFSKTAADGTEVSCDVTDPASRSDIGRLVREGKWDRDAKCWVAKTAEEPVDEEA